MKKIFFSMFLVSFLMSNQEVIENDFLKDNLKGDEKLACEAILCLSVKPIERPKECDKALKKYFLIKHQDPNKETQARDEFLKLCPKK